MDQSSSPQNICQMAESEKPASYGSVFELQNVRVAEALSRFGGDEERYRHWLVEFVDHGPNATAQIRQAITSGSQDAAVKLTHALKGRTGMLGMNELHSISQTLEMALRDGEPTQLWLEELEDAVAEMRRQIEKNILKT